MFSDTQDHEVYSPPGGSPYFELKSTLQRYVSEKNWIGAERSARDMLAIYPNSDFAYYILGMALARQRNYPEALLNLKKALYLNPDLMSAHYQLGIAAYYQKEFVTALHHFNAALEKGMNSHFLHYNMGNTWYQMSDFRAAIRAYLRSLSLCPEFTPAAYGLFRVYFKNQEYQLAVSALRPVISDEKLPEYLFAQARLLYENDPETNAHKLREAHRLLTCAIDLNSEFALAYYERAYVNSKLNDLHGFARDKNTAFSLDPHLRKGHTFGLYSSRYI